MMNRMFDTGASAGVVATGGSLVTLFVFIMMLKQVQSIASGIAGGVQFSTHSADQMTAPGMLFNRLKQYTTGRTGIPNLRNAGHRAASRIGGLLTSKRESRS
jgi:hypothetical protein